MTPADARKFSDGPGAKAATKILEESGVYGFNDDFDRAIAEAAGPAAGREVERKYQALTKALSGEPLKRLLMQLDDAHAAEVLRRTEVSFLVGVEVGRRLR